KAPLADEAERGTYLGFDTFAYPGDAKMRAWKNAPKAPFKWVGFYLPGAPCHRGKTWDGKRQTLVDMGWGIAVVYVGQQTWGRKPRPLTPAQVARLERTGQACNANLLSAERGTRDGKEAADLTRAQGFPKGTVIFLDIERSENMPQAMRDYYKAWTQAVFADGRFQPGYYVHKHNARMVYDDVRPTFVAHGVQTAPRFWVASARDFSPEKEPEEVGHEFAGAWQGVIDVVREVADVALPIDINVSNWRSPSDVID
ncbi:MAG TPA: glycoside hydrolase domain-containing protein, partial [Gemmatimonadaceae bacterium]|nr:glycoside hydrolase domain-containing protein [Gemmatimonadaceae bacterium]